MKKNLFLDDKIYIAGSTGMAGSAIIRSLKKVVMGKKKTKENFLSPQEKN